MGETCLRDYTYIADYTCLCGDGEQISGDQKKLKRYCKSARALTANWLFIAVMIHYVQKNLIREN